MLTKGSTMFFMTLRGRSEMASGSDVSLEAWSGIEFILKTDISNLSCYRVLRGVIANEVNHQA
jgi:hypothetical protein